ncbi:hypothetical protein R1sor_008866 [Riccia sorocarpa]|uniref:Integrase catalytic domain-containing protein n=1 Tax=Riccia sorocarpa TaxID=122646 RepID=A0ABD3H6Y7_9MARC
MQNAMHKVLREFVPEITITFLDDIPMKGCATEEKDEAVDATGCRKFVSDHVRDVGKILNRLREVHLTLSGEKSRFGVPEILVVGHVCDSSGRRPNPVKVEAIARLADCRSTTEVRRFLGSCVFFRLSIPHYAHMAEPLYALLKKGKKFIWSLLHHDAMEKLKKILPFKKDLYGGKLRDIGFYLSTLERRGDWNEAEFKKIRQKAYGFLLRDGYLWKRPKRMDGDFLRVVDDEDTKLELLKEFHETLWARHRGVWATYTKLNERYWWKGMYNDVDKFVGSCLHCQFYSKVRHRDGLVPTYPPSIHFRWVLDLVMMPPGLWGMRYLVLAREDLSNFVEGRALRTKSVEGISRFVLEDIVCRYGSVGSLRAERGDLNAEEARTFFRRYGVNLKLTTAMNPECIGKSERGHPPIVHALVKACDGKYRQWPRLLPFALWADKSTHSTTTGYMPVQLMLGQKPIMPIEDTVLSWVSLPWEDGVDHKTLLALRIRQLERREEDLADAQEKLKQARLKNKFRFDKTHRLRPKQIKLDGTPLRLAIAGKRVKLFKRRDDTSELLDFIDLEHGAANNQNIEENDDAEEEED